MLNPFFNQVTYEPEQELIQDLMDEAIQIYGHETYYIPRDTVNLDEILGEDTIGTYTSAIPLEMYIKSSMTFAGQSEFISKFGLTIEDQCVFTVSQRRFHQEVPADLMVRPRIGDIVWIQMTPMNRSLFEIRFVEAKEQLFQLGKLYTYELRCELMNYSHERVSTDIPEVDGIAVDEAYSLLLHLGTGSGTYILGEVVYQGASFLEAGATGLVSQHDADANTLTVHSITGTFVGNTAVLGVTSGASYTVLTTPALDPVVADPQADNRRVEDAAATVIVSRGNNPRYR